MSTANAPYQICTRCVMDTSDPEITFDASGTCSHCQRYDTMVADTVDRASRGERLPELMEIVEKIKAAGAGKEYDCIMGLSGGVDSSYVAVTAKRFGLRPLAVHFDSGWNSELAVNNIENIVKKLDIDLQTFVVDWEEMRDLQLAFFKSGVPNCDIPTDHAFPAILYREAKRHGIKYILSGSNFATEFILPTSWGYQSGDLLHLRAIHKRFGTTRLRAYPQMGFFAQYIWYPYVAGIKTVKPLNYINYQKADAKAEIQKQLGWRDYGGKHYESIFTRFFQSYYLPVRFGFDKRRAHLSSLVNSGQLSRDQALEEVSKPAFDPEVASSDKSFIAKKLGLTAEQLDQIFEQPPHPHSDYPSIAPMFSYGLKVKHWLFPT